MQTNGNLEIELTLSKVGGFIGSNPIVLVVPSVFVRKKVDGIKIKITIKITIVNMEYIAQWFLQFCIGLWVVNLCMGRIGKLVFIIGWVALWQLYSLTY